MKIRISLMVLVIIPMLAKSQYSIADTDVWRVRTSKNNMLILGGWALANIGTGIYGNLTSTGSTKYFHQMNVGWNAVNLGIAAAGYLLTRPLKDPDLYDLTQRLIGIENSLMLNTGLDFAYITAGIAMRSLANSENSGNPDRLRGFGSSLILQGAFLAIFDIYQFSMYKNRRNTLLKNQLSQMSVVPLHNGMAIRF
ncbi:MAG: DUF6992 family protein [Thermaurantimonas sp.]